MASETDHEAARNYAKSLESRAECERLRELLRQARDEDDVVSNEDWRNEVTSALLSKGVGDG